ncbi:hypothetical protein ACJEQE_31460, partial [Klebsiella pneumoniae]|uniref:hypothetical protein n=1 Tax=Klebsiella pneumoniae TaxID=573 RepID=UPI003871BBDA
AAESYGAGRISSSAGWRFAYPAYITIKFQKVNHHRRPAQAQRRRAKDIAPSQTKKKPEVSLRLFSITSRYALGHVFVLRHRVAEAFGH